MKRVTTFFLLSMIISFNVRAQTNVALNKNATASSEVQAAGFAVDGDNGTRWETVGTDPQWIVIDLEDTVSIGEVILSWEGAYASAYEIQVTNDTTGSWSTIFTETSGDGGEDELTVSGTGRFIRMYGTTRGTIYGYSLWEFEVYEEIASASDATLGDLQLNGAAVDGFSKLTVTYDLELPIGTIQVPTVTATPTQGTASVDITSATSFPGSTEILVTAEDGTTTKKYTINFTVDKGTNIAQGKTAVASSDIQAAGFAVDGIAGSRWESASTDPQWILVDLEESIEIGRVVLSWEGAYASAYEIQVTDDTTGSWTTIFTETSGNGGEDDLDVVGTGRFVRMYGTTRGTPYGYSLWEFEIYAAESYSIIGGDAGWRMLSIPVSGATVGDISDDSPVQGITGGDNASATDANFYIYDTDGVFEKPTNTTTPWGDGYGFIMYFFNNTTAGSSELPVTLGAEGKESQSDVVVNINDSNGYTLVGNPFTNNLALDDIEGNGSSGVSSGLISPIQVWDDGAGDPSAGDAGSTTGSYVTYNFGAGQGEVIAPWQGFMLQSDDATTVTMEPSDTTSSPFTVSALSKRVLVDREIKFELSGPGNSLDKAAGIYFLSGEDEGLGTYDGSKLQPLLSEYATIALKNGDQLLAQESRSFELTSEQRFELEFTNVGLQGEFTLSWPTWNNIPEEWNILLTDHKTNMTVNMQEESSYVFTATSKAKASANSSSLLRKPDFSMKSKSAESRFSIVITNTSVNNEQNPIPQKFELAQNYPNPFNPTTTIGYTISRAGNVTLSIYNTKGQKVATLLNENKSPGEYTLRWNAVNYATGIYFYRLESAGQVVTRKMILIK